MKKVLLGLMLALMLVSTLGVNVLSASAGSLISYDYGIYVWGKGIVFVFDASGYRNKDVKDASILIGSNFHHLGCTVNKPEEKSCVWHAVDLQNMHFKQALSTWRVSYSM